MEIESKERENIKEKFFEKLNSFDEENLIGLENLLFGKLSGLNHTYRFSGQKKIRNQSVAEHSYWTSIIAVQLARYENFMNKKNGDLVSPIDIEKLYDVALMHDVDEVLTGDLNHRFKHSEFAENFRRELNILLYKVVEKVLFEKTFLGNQLYKSWEYSHQESDYNYFLKIGDWLQLLQYSVEEVEFGNINFKSKVSRVIKLILDKNQKQIDLYLEGKTAVLYTPILINKFIHRFIRQNENLLQH